MTDDLVNRLRKLSPWSEVGWFATLNEAADRIEELKRHIELRDFFLSENDLWEKFAKGEGGKMDDQ